MKNGFVVTFALILAGCAQEEGPERTAAEVENGGAAAAAAGPARDAPAATPITEIEPARAVIAEDVAYGETAVRNLRGYMVLPADAVDPPGVLMIHEWWGLNDNVRAMARRLAGEGYAVLAIDLYGGETATSAADARRLMTAVMNDRESALDNIRQAHGYLDEVVLAPRIGVLGWSLGAGWSLEAGLDLGDAIDAVVMFYGPVVADAGALANLKAPLLGIFAQRDESVPSRDVLEFRGSLNDLGKSARVEIYMGVDHAFADPSVGAYDQEAAERAWAEALTFLDDRLR